MATNGTSNAYKFLIFGNGWVSGLVQETLQKNGDTYEVSKVRIEDREAVLRELDTVKPTHVINTAGARGSPNVDWCEDHKDYTVRSNIIGAANLVDCCFLRGIHITHFASGCIYDQDEAHPLDGSGFTEDDTPNFWGSFYSYSKLISEKVLKTYPNVLVLRLRNPVAADLHPKNFVTKLLGYKKIVNIPNSGSVMTNLVPGAIILAKHKETGVYNYTNPGTFTHNEVMGLMKEYVRPSLTWVNFTLDEQSQVLKAPRSNAKLDSTKLANKLKEYGYEVLPAHEALVEAFALMKDKGLQ
ncbi:hypothetical protein PVAR5_7026 [Paecilomyces variotii No. 5]|uniref:NAD-dependent epimerase/dehydratase domain-containing protein n=1 Tax=Byssochlamys spectabilis (strain No. 5 / NBRC 109023) TaxID=1356009 RepID=V5FKC3_BYSSN|nr:hypothetical protein PVAR5_7026 [Paecilomyces variotii No. 5]